MLYDIVRLLCVVAVSGLAAYDHYRLPRSVEPQHYELHILTRLEDAKQLRFEGLVKISLQVLEPSTNITLHAKNLTIHESQIALRKLGESNESNCIKQIELNEKYEYYIMHLCEQLLPGVEYELNMPFESALNPNQTGYYRSSYKETNSNETRWLALTQFSPTFARLAFPCFDEPDFKATFNITLGYHKQYMGFSNMPIRICKPHESLDNYVWCSHEQLFRTSTYLVAFAVHNLSHTETIVSNTRNEISFRSWLRPNALQQGEYFAQLAPRILAYQEKLFNLSLPLSKIDQLIAPDHLFSAMENWGLVTFQENAFLYDGNAAMQEKKESMASTMAHEYAHQWFGNMVTMRWWDNLWLKEGFSTYFAYLSVDQEQPAWGYGLRQTRTNLAQFFHDDACNVTRAITKEVRQPADILKHFSPYVYQKGALMVRMLHKILGDEAFYIGIHKYLHSYAYGNVNEAELWRTFEQATHAQFNLSAAMSSWTFQEGYPVLHVQRNYATRTAMLRQERFLWQVPEQHMSASCWWLPLSYVISSRMDFEQTQPKLWLECNKSAAAAMLLDHMPNADEWIMFNPQVNAIYRVNYDEHNWQLITETLQDVEQYKLIHVLNRAQLVDDIMALAWNGVHNYRMALGLLQYLTVEREYLPWQAAISQLKRINALLSLERRHLMKSYMTTLIEPLYKNLTTTYTLQPAMLPLQRLVYDLACSNNLSDCASRALQSFQHYDLVPIDFRDIFYCSAVEHGSVENFSFLLKRFQNSTQPNEQRLLATSLGCTQHFAQMQEFLDFTLNSTDKMLSSNFALAIAIALQKEHIANETKSYFLSHAARIVEKYRAKDLKQAMLPLAKMVNTLADYTQLKQQLQAFKKFDELVLETVEKSLINLQWQQTRAEEFNSEINNSVH